MLVVSAKSLPSIHGSESRKPQLAVRGFCPRSEEIRSSCSCVSRTSVGVRMMDMLDMLKSTAAVHDLGVACSRAYWVCVVVGGIFDSQERRESREVDPGVRGQASGDRGRPPGISTEDADGPGEREI